MVKLNFSGIACCRFIFHCVILSLLLSIEPKRWWFRAHRSFPSYVFAMVAMVAMLEDGITIFRSPFYCEPLHAWSITMLGPTIHITPQVSARLCWNYLDSQSVRNACICNCCSVRSVWSRDVHIEGHLGVHSVVIYRGFSILVWRMFALSDANDRCWWYCVAVSSVPVQDMVKSSSSEWAVGAASIVLLGVMASGSMVKYSVSMVMDRGWVNDLGHLRSEKRGSMTKRTKQTNKQTIEPWEWSAWVEMMMSSVGGNPFKLSVTELAHSDESIHGHAS